MDSTPAHVFSRWASKLRPRGIPVFVSTHVQETISNNTDKKPSFFETMRDYSNHARPFALHLIILDEGKEQILVAVCCSVLAQCPTICHGLLHNVGLTEAMHEDVSVAVSFTRGCISFGLCT